MSKIIRKGDEKYFVTCTNCGAQFEYDIKDIKPFTGWVLGNVSDYVIYPKCNKQVDHIKGKILTPYSNYLTTTMVVDYSTPNKL